jgi:hypothetical protein
MKRNLVKGIILISAVVLSSCSSTGKLADLTNTNNDDDVYYTKAKAGDKIEYISDNQQNTDSYNGDDNYYYYGDYATRLNRFSSYSPFDYDDNFYYSYVPYNNGFGQGLSYDLDYYGYNYGYGHASNLSTPMDNGYIYSPYDYGYSPYYDMGYDDFGYGDIYAAYILGGGGGGGGYGRSWHHYNNTNVIAGNTSSSGRGIRTIPSPGVTRIGYYPGQPLVNINRINGVTGRNVNSVNGNNNVSRQQRDVYSPQQQSAPQQQSISTSSGNSGGSTSSGGGGRPVRP